MIIIFVIEGVVVITEIEVFEIIECIIVIIVFV
jgi:hypothetical protein